MFVIIPVIWLLYILNAPWWCWGFIITACIVKFASILKDFYEAGKDSKE